MRQMRYVALMAAALGRGQRRLIQAAYSPDAGSRACSWSLKAGTTKCGLFATSGMRRGAS